MQVQRYNPANGKGKFGGHTRRKCLIAGLSALMILGASINVYADQSARWVGSGDRWQVSDNAGGYLKNTWFQDDVTGHWYLLGAEDGSVMYAGLVTDQSTGKTYLMNVSHDGTFGRMISTNGVYNINGKSISLTFNQNHDGTFGAITSGLQEVRSSGVAEKSLSSIPTADNTTTHTNIYSDGNKTQTKGSYYDGMTVDSSDFDQKTCDFDGDGKLTGLEYETYKSMRAMDGVEQGDLTAGGNIH